MSEQPAIEQLEEKLNDLLEAAKTGAIIPVRLPGQVEEIVNLLAKTKKEQAEAAVSADMEDYIKEEAYFVGHAVHELRTPITSIRGYSDMMGSMGELNDMQKQFLDVIITNSKRMQSLLADVSFINKIRKGTLKVAKKMDMFKNIAMRVEKDMMPLAEELGKELTFDIPQGLPLLNTDGDHLTVAINKLVENALRYTPKEGGQVAVIAGSNENTLIVQVVDNGIGMPAEEIEQLGTIYFRSDHDVVREFKGSGLGIPIAYGMVQVLGGTIDVESTPDEGTTFTVRLEGMS